MTSKTSAQNRLAQVKHLIVGKKQDAKSIPWDPDNTSFPSRREIVAAAGQPDGAVWVWGSDDFCGRLNLLTPTRIKAAAAEIRTGETAALDLPSHIPETPAFGREAFQHEIKALVEGKAYDDIYHLNTQSGTQWDGFRHVAHQPTTAFYNNTRSSDFARTDKCSIHHWREHGFSGRGILLDYRRYAETHAITYDTTSAHEISYTDLLLCGRWQGLDIRPASQGGDVRIGDILFLRTGWTQDYYKRSSEENARLATRKRAVWAGLKQEDAVLDWLHDCYFAAVAGDQPAFEVWPSKQRWMLHEYLLALWGVPIGEMVDLERVSELARRNARYTFFVTSAPFRTVGGVASWMNATAIF